MLDFRNDNNIELMRLYPQTNLMKKLPLRNCYVEQKLNGARFSIQFGRGSCFLVSRGRHNAAHGVAVSKNESFCVVDAPENFQFLRNLSFRAVLDGEFMAKDGSAVNEAMMKEGEKQLHIFDILYYENDFSMISYVKEGLHLKYRKDDLISVMDEIKAKFPEQDALVLNPWLEYDEITEETVQELTESAKSKKIEGYVIKPINGIYQKRCGFKLKPIRDSLDGFIVNVKPAKKHNLGKVTTSNIIGSVGLAQVFPDGVSYITAFVSLAGLKIPLSDKDSILGKVVEFSSFGWDDANKRWSFPQFVRLRDDTEKSKSECTLDL